MIVNCAHCHVALYVNDSKVPQSGAKGRCSRCQHEVLIGPLSSGDKPDNLEEAQVVSSSLGDSSARPPKPAAGRGPRIDLPSEEIGMRSSKPQAGERLPTVKSRTQIDKGTAGVAIAFVVLLSTLHLAKLATFLGTMLVFLSFGVYLLFSYLLSGRIRIHSYKDVLCYSGGLFVGMLIKIFAPM
jgi:predicted Zn finger-like uncharacterized protein